MKTVIFIPNVADLGPCLPGRHRQARSAPRKRASGPVCRQAYMRHMEKSVIYAKSISECGGVTCRRQTPLPKTTNSAIKTSD